MDFKDKGGPVESDLAQQWAGVGGGVLDTRPEGNHFQRRTGLRERKRVSPPPPPPLLAADAGNRCPYCKLTVLSESDFADHIGRCYSQQHVAEQAVGNTHATGVKRKSPASSTQNATQNTTRMPKRPARERPPSARPRSRGLGAEIKVGNGSGSIRDPAVHQGSNGNATPPLPLSTAQLRLLRIFQESAERGDAAGKSSLESVLRWYSMGEPQRVADFLANDADIMIKVDLSREIPVLLRAKRDANGRLNGAHFASQDFSSNQSPQYTGPAWNEAIYAPVESVLSAAGPTERPLSGLVNIVNDPHGWREWHQNGFSYLRLARKNTALRGRVTLALGLDRSHIRVGTLGQCRHILGECIFKEDLRNIVKVAHFYDPSVSGSGVPWVSSQFLKKIFPHALVHGPVRLGIEVDTLVVNRRHRGNAQIQQGLRDLQDVFPKLTVLWEDQEEMQVPGTTAPLSKKNPNGKSSVAP